jgi:hypothetical protein
MKIIFGILIFIILLILIMVIFNLGPFKTVIKNKYSKKDLDSALIARKKADRNRPPKPPGLNPSDENEATLDEEDKFIKMIENEIIESDTLFKDCLNEETNKKLGKNKCKHIKPNEFGKPLNEVNFFEYSDEYLPEWDKPFQINELPKDCPNDIDKHDDINKNYKDEYSLWRTKQEELRALFKGKKECDEIKQEDIINYFKKVGKINIDNKGSLDQFEKDYKVQLKAIEEKYSNNPDLKKITNTCLIPPGPKCYTTFKKDSEEQDQNLEVLDFNKPGCKEEYTSKNTEKLKLRVQKKKLTAQKKKQLQEANKKKENDEKLAEEALALVKTN